MRKPGWLQGLYYGWVMLLALSVTETVSFGILYYAFTVFIKPMQQELGWSRGELTAAFSIALVVGGVAGVPVGRWLDRKGTRVLMTAGSIVATLLVLAWAGVSNLGLFYLIWVGIGVSMAAVLYEPAFVVVAVWFRKQRNRALTILTFIAGFASVIFIPLAEWLVQLQGWRGALVTLGIVLGIVTIPLHGLVLRRKPQDLGLLPDGATPDNAAQNQPGLAALDDSEHSFTLKEALKTTTFWWLTASFTFNTLGVVAITVHLIPYLTDLGYASGFAALVVGLIGILALPGRLIFNLLAERIPRRFLTTFIFLLQAIALVVLLVFTSTWGVFIFAALFGAGFGAITPLRAGLVVELYGPAHYGRISSISSLFTTAARGLGPVGIGLAFDVIKSYTPLFWLLALISLGSALTILFVQKPSAHAPTDRETQPASVSS